MVVHRDKTSTDVFWNAQAQREADFRKVNIADLAQRRLENAFLFKYLRPEQHVLEVGCGNGFLTAEIRDRVSAVDSFDFANAMIASAKSSVGERNNRFFVGSVLSPETTQEQYDVVVCVRVLINLANLEEQKLAVSNLARWTRPGGRLVLIEGFLDAFEALNALRAACGAEPMKPAAINFYSHVRDLTPALEQYFDVEDEWHSGMFDVLTRVAYPLLVGADQATGYSDFHDRTLPLAMNLNPDAFKPLARVRGFSLVRRASA